MYRATRHLGLMSWLHVSNVWLLDDGAGGRFLVDTGHWVGRGLLAAELWRAGIRRQGDLTAVLLTHRHSDHAGNARWLRERYGCPVIAHPQDAKILSGEATAPSLARGTAPLYQELLCRFEDRFPARTPVDEVYEDGTWRWGFRVIPVPGHTEGSVLLYHEPTRTLFSGDAILAGASFFRFVERMFLAVPGFSLDVDACHAKVREFLREMPDVGALAAGHGPAIVQEAGRKLRRLAETARS